MGAISAGLLMYDDSKELKLFLAHPGGPYFKNKDDGWWTIPKGLVESDEEDLQNAAKREFTEETGIEPSGLMIDLGFIKQKSGKQVYCWAFKGSAEQSIELQSNNFILEWPPRSGKQQEFPEIDRAQWFDLQQAQSKIMAAQAPLLERLCSYLGL